MSIAELGGGAVLVKAAAYLQAPTVENQQAERAGARTYASSAAALGIRLVPYLYKGAQPEGPFHIALADRGRPYNISGEATQAEVRVWCATDAFVFSPQQWQSMLHTAVDRRELVFSTRCPREPAHTTTPLVPVGASFSPKSSRTAFCAWPRSWG